MKVLEIKNNLVKIAYDVTDSLALSGFLIIEDENSPYVGQIMNLNTDDETNAATAKLLFTFNKDGIVKNYDGSIPSIKATVTKLPSQELLDILPVKTVLKMGTLAQQNSSLNVDFSLLERDLVTCVENEANKNLLLKNFVIQLENSNKKTVIFDIDGLYDNQDKIIFGKDFKLPLNFQTIDFIYENDLDDVDAVSKAIIQDIFLEVQEYTKTVGNKFIPFDTFINVVDGQYRETEIPQLILLKNKLLKYKEENVFAQSIDDIESLKTTFSAGNTTVLDISVFNTKLQKEIVSHVYNIMSEIKNDFYSFVTLTNFNSDKKILKRFLTEENIFTNIFCSHEYKYLPELKQYASNLILFAPQTTQHDFAAYNIFLNKLNADEFILSGNLTQNIPFIVELDEINLADLDEDDEIAVKEEPQADNVIGIDDSDNIVTVETTSSEEVALLIENEENEIIEREENHAIAVDLEEINEDEEAKEALIEQVAKDVDNMFIYSNTEEEILSPIEGYEADDIETLEEDTEIEAVVEEISFDEDLTEDDLDFIEDLNQDTEESNSTTIQTEELEPAIEIVEDEETEEFKSSDDFSEQLEEEFSSTIEEEFEQPEEELPEAEFIKEETVPVVPIYDADEFIPDKDTESFDQGDSVSHPKYGHGVVEKMIKYGNKTLCSINFDNVGRRLLDPAISEITKL